MATTASVPNDKGPAKAQSSSILVPILSSVMASCIMGGAVIFYLMHSGKLSGAAAAPVAAVAKVDPTTPMALDPFLVNLADAGGHSYLRATLMLQVTMPPVDKKAAAKKPEGKGDVDPVATEERAAMRDSILTVLSSQTADTLLAPDGKDALKKTLIEQLNKVEPEMKVKEIYFTEFLVQR